MHGYWDDEAKTREAIGVDKWFWTGDVAIMNEKGYISIAGRAKDLIIRGGENIYPGG
jgi:fatty-acyl-CoA synthase